MKKNDNSGRMDNAAQKRVELNMHTNMSEMSGVSPAEELIHRAFEFGHKAAAITDCGCVQAFPEVMRTVEKIRENGGDIKPIYGMEAYFVNDNGVYIKPSKSTPVYKITILAKNKAGLKNLYKLVSLSYSDRYFYCVPLIFLSEMQKHRNGLIIGSGGANGELFRAILDKKSSEIIDEISEKYDYFEIQPAAGDKEKQVNTAIAKLAQKQGKLCAATGNVYFKDEENGISRKIIRSADGDKNADEQLPLYFKTTDEMLSEFMYLGTKKAFEAVVTNTNAIADMIDADIRPIPKGAFSPPFPDAEEEFSRICWKGAHARYGEKLPEIVEKRLERELKLIGKYNFAPFYMTAKRLVDCSEENGYHVTSRGSLGSVFAAFLSGITDIDPLPPHYLCPKCGYSEFVTDGSVNSGFDLPRKNCSDCGCDMARDGHDIPFETFMGYNGWNVPKIHLNFSDEISEEMLRGIRELFGENRAFAVGRITKIGLETARSYAEKYFEERGAACNENEIECLAESCANTKRSMMCSVGSLVIIPNGHDVYDFTPIDRLKGIFSLPTTHFDHNNLCGALPTINLLPNNKLTLFKRLEDTTGVKFSGVPMDDPSVLRLFTSIEPLKLSENIGVECGTLGIPEFGTEFVMKIMSETQPKTFYDIVKISGLSHSTNVCDNARELIKDGVCTLSDVIAVRDDIMLYLIGKGFAPLLAYNIGEMTRMGIARQMFDDDPYLYKEFKDHGVPDWFVESCKKIRCIFPKAYAVAYSAAAVKLAWFKLHYPSEFYAAVLENNACYLERDIVEKGIYTVKSRVEELQRAMENGGSFRDSDELYTYLLALELMLRGLKIKDYCH